MTDYTYRAKRTKMSVTEFITITLKKKVFKFQTMQRENQEKSTLNIHTKILIQFIKVKQKLLWAIISQP
jgi:hypothetical protein